MATEHDAEGAVDVGEAEVIVVGGGVSGLVAAGRLAAAGVGCVVLEARPALGGRVHTQVLAEPAVALDLGASWVWPHQRAIGAVLDALGLPTFAQAARGRATFDPGPTHAPVTYAAPSFPPNRARRIVGGTAALTAALADRLATRGLPARGHGSPEAAVAARVVCGAVVEHLTLEGDAVRLDGVLRRATPDGDGARARSRPVRGRARVIVIAVPPRVAASHLAFAPALSPELTTALRDTPTWMAHVLKVALAYDSPFWHDAGRSGYVLAATGPLQEVHDASPAAVSSPAVARAGGTRAAAAPRGRPGALIGFVASRATTAGRAFRALPAEAQASTILEQLARTLGAAARDARAVRLHDWAREPWTSGAGDDAPPTTLPTYSARPYAARASPTPWARHLVWAGSETSAVEGGYLDGAVRAGLRAAGHVLRQLRRR